MMTSARNKEFPREPSIFLRLRIVQQALEQGVKACTVIPSKINLWHYRPQEMGDRENYSLTMSLAWSRLGANMSSS